MRKRELWKDWCLMSKDEQDKYLNDENFLECYLDNTNSDIDIYNKEEYKEYCIDCINEYFNDDFGQAGNWFFSPLKNQKVAVTGLLGLWNGIKKIQPKEFNNLYEAIQACLEEYNELYEDQYGNLHILAHHHDGTNSFVIKKVTDKGLRCLHFCKEVFGC